MLEENEQKIKIHLQKFQLALVQVIEIFSHPGMLPKIIDITQIKKQIT